MCISIFFSGAARVSMNNASKSESELNLNFKRSKGHKNKNIRCFF